MIVAGSIYGVVLNDVVERERFAAAFAQPPYDAPPEAPVVYLRPRLCATTGGAPVPLPAGSAEVTVAATLALLFARDATAVSVGDAWGRVGAACLALDVSLPSANYYRPAVAERCRDGFLPLGAPAAPMRPDEIVTTIDGAVAHRWSLARLVRPIEALVADLSAFMTLRAGDLLLVGLAGDAPRARAGQQVGVEGGGMPPIRTRIVEDET